MTDDTPIVPKRNRKIRAVTDGRQLSDAFLEQVGRGRPKGAANKVTTEVRTLCQLVLSRQEEKIDAWFDRVAKKDPSKALDHFIHLAEVCMPKTTTVESTPMAARNEAGQSVFTQRVREMLGYRNGDVGSQLDAKSTD